MEYRKSGVDSRNTGDAGAHSGNTGTQGGIQEFRDAGVESGFREFSNTGVDSWNTEAEAYSGNTGT